MRRGLSIAAVSVTKSVTIGPHTRQHPTQRDATTCQVTIPRFRHNVRACHAEFVHPPNLALVGLIGRSAAGAAVDHARAAAEAQRDAVNGLLTANRYVVPGVSA